MVLMVGPSDTMVFVFITYLLYSHNHLQSASCQTLDVNQPFIA